MVLLRSRRTKLTVSALAVLVSACSGADITLPGDARPSHIEIITGDDQAGIAGTALAQALVVKVTDDLDRPVEGETVEFTVQVGAGGVAPATVQTDTGGRATSVWTLGPGAGTQEVEARAVGQGAPDDLAVTFSASAVAGSGSLLLAVSGDDQMAPVNSELPESLVVRASDAGGNPVEGVTVQWTVQGGGSISPQTVVTGNDGKAAALRILGPSAGQQTANAAAEGLVGSPVTFVQTALASAPAALVMVSGDGQTAPAGFEVAEDLVVQLTDAGGNGVGSRPVTWVVTTGGGTASPVNSTTDPKGFARTRWTLGSSAGGDTLNAVFSGLPPVRFTATASADVPTRLTMVSGNGQSGIVGKPLANPLVVKVTDANDNPVENVSVAWNAGGGSVASPTSATNSDGIAQTVRTLGPTPGSYGTTAAVEGLTGSPVTFTSTAAVGQAAKLVIVTQPGGPARSGEVLPAQPVVQIQDDQGNNVGPARQLITAALASGPGGGSLGGDATRETDANGRASFANLSISGAVGTYALRFTSGTLPVVTSNGVSVTSGPVSAIQSTVMANPDQIGAGGSTTITVTARDAAGNPVVGATVLLAATGAGNLTPTTGTTGTSGGFTSTFSSTGVGQHTITARIDGVDVIDNAVVTLASGPVSPTQSSVDANPTTIGAGGSSTITVTARDGSGNPIQGATVQLNADGAGNALGQPGATNGSGVATGTFSSTGFGPHTVSATINGTAINDVATVTVTAGEGTRLVIATQPDDNVQNAAQFSPQPVVQVQDDQGNNVGPGGRPVTATLASGPGGATLNGDLTRETDGNGRAAFNNLSITGPVGTYTIQFTSGTLATATSNGITVTVGPVSASQSTVTADPGQIAVGGAPSTITVTARDAGGNAIAGANVELHASGGGNQLGDPGTTNSSGMATATFTSNNLGQHTISARVANVNITAEAIVTVTSGPVSATESTLNAAPGQFTAGGSSTVTVTARDAGGNPVSNATVSLSATGGGSFTTPAPTGSNGVTTATFTATAAGSHVISATINSTAINHNATVTVQAGPAASIAFTDQPTDTQVNQVISPAVVVSVEDEFGNPANGTVVMSLEPPIGGTGELHGTLSVSASGGTATFSDLTVDAAAFLPYQLIATLGDLTVTSNDFLITP